MFVKTFHNTPLLYSPRLTVLSRSHPHDLATFADEIAGIIKTAIHTYLKDIFGRLLKHGGSLMDAVKNQVLYRRVTGHVFKEAAQIRTAAPGRPGNVIQGQLL